MTVVELPRVAFVASAHPTTLTVPSSAYPTIQSAVNAASPSDTILVAAGTYREHVVIAKSVNITGASRSITVIDGTGGGPGVNIIDANNVVVQGFTINNTGFFEPAIFVNSSSLVLISNDLLSASVQADGIDLLDSSQVSVINNVFSGNFYGVHVQRGFSNRIQYNNATGNIVGVAVYSSSGNKITDNSLRMSQDGLELRAGSSGNVIARNVVSNNSVGGISVQDSGSSLIFENSIENNNADPRNTEGINIQNAVSNRFYHNNIRSNAIQAFAVYPPGDRNIWDNTTGSALSSDPKITFVDSKSSGHWDYNDTVVYDSDANGVYDPGEPVIASVSGLTPAPGSTVKSFPGLKFVDRFGSGVWKRGDPVVNDTNNDNVFEAGEPAIAGVGGNYWSDYTGRDNGANGFALNGIGDTLIPWPCPNGGGTSTACPSGSPREDDWYPLMSMWVPPNMNVTATASPISGFPPLQVSLQGKVAGGTAPYNYSWSFGDGTTGLGSSVVHTYAMKGSFVAVLTVSDSAFRTRSDSVGVSVVVGSLVVRVVDASRKQIVGANVTSTVQPAGQPVLGAISNSSGSVFFTGLLNGTYSIQAADRGFVTSSTSVNVVLGGVSNVTITLNTVPLAQSSSQLLWLVGGALAAVIVATVGFLAWRSRRRRLAVISRTVPSSEVLARFE